MRYYFTEEDHLTRVRARDVRAPLVHAGHTVVHGRPGTPPPRNTDVWLHGLGYNGDLPIDARLVDQLLSCRADVVLFQLCDAESMWFHRIPQELAKRTRLFLRNHWPTDRQRIPEAFRDRLGWMPPMMGPTMLHRGRALSERSRGAIFYGTRTGKLNLPGGKNSREETVRIMRTLQLPFDGGLSPHDDRAYVPPPELVVPRIGAREHARRLRDAKICLCPWGNHVLTYRLFEGLATRALVLTQPIGDAEFLDGGLERGKHYVEVAADLGNLVELVRHYLSHLDEAQRIADSGYAHFERFFAPRGRLVSAWTFEQSVASWGDLFRPAGKRSVTRALMARFAPTLF